MAMQSGERLRVTRSMSWIMFRSLGFAVVALAVASAGVWLTQSLGRALSDHVSQWAWAPRWLNSAATWGGEPPPAGMNYQAIATAALAVIGTLASVYFATVAFVISTTYRDATSRVRSLVTRLPEGRVYAFMYVQAVLFGLAVLLLPLFNRQPNRLTLSTLAILGSLVVLSFGRLRTQLYELLEPARLLRMVHRDITRWLTYALRGRRSTRVWRVQTARSEVFESLLTLRELCRLIRDREHESPNTPPEYTMVDPRTRTAVQMVVGMWIGYSARKDQLIVLPGWCLMRAKHKDWLVASNYEVAMALGTATTLQAESTEDDLWLERYLSLVLADLLGGRGASEYSNLVEGLDQVPLQLMAFGLFEDARLWLDLAVMPAMDIVAARSETSADGSGQEPTGTAQPVLAHEHNLADFVGLSFAQVVLGMQHYAASISHGFPGWVSRQALGHRERRVGHKPTELFRKIKDGLAFERKVQGLRITSDANIHQLIARDLAAELIDEAAWLVGTIEADFAPWVATLCERPSFPAAAAASRLDEILHKSTDVLQAALERCFAECEAVHRDVDDAWPSLDLAWFRQRLERMKQDLRLPIAQLASRADARLDASRPDIFGWAFHRAHADLLDDLLDPSWDGDPTERLLQLVSATDRAMTRLQTATRRTHARIANAFSAEPVLLLLQISGIAYVLDRFEKRSRLFDPFERVWKALLKQDPQRILDTSLAAVISDDLLFSLSSGKMSRTARMDRALDTFEIFQVDRFPLGQRRRRVARDDAARIAERAVADHLCINGDFEDVFVAGWLLPEAIQLGATLREDLVEGTRLKRLITDLDAARIAEQHSATTQTDPMPQAGDHK